MCGVEVEVLVESADRAVSVREVVVLLRHRLGVPSENSVDRTEESMVHLGGTRSELLKEVVSVRSEEILISLYDCFRYIMSTREEIAKGIMAVVALIVGFQLLAFLNGQMSLQALLTPSYLDFALDNPLLFGLVLVGIGSLPVLGGPLLELLNNV